MKKKVKWGVLGTGRIADRLLRHIQESEVATTVAVAGRDKHKAAALAEKHGVSRGAENFEALIDDPEVEVVYNATPNHWHHPWTIRALEAGKDVLCEKPLSLNTREAEEMFEAADRHGRRLMEAFAFRSHPQTTQIRELVRGGEIGELAVIRTCFCFFLDDLENVRWVVEEGGGALYDIGCYCINMSRWIAGEEPDRATGVAVTVENGVDATTAAALHFPGGAVAGFECSFRGDFRVGVEIVGSLGRIEVPSPWKPVKTLPIRLFQGEEGSEIPVSGVDAYQLQVDHFSRCSRGEERPYVSAEDSIGNMRVIDQIRSTTQAQTD